MNFYLEDISDLCDVRRKMEEDGGNIESVLFVSSVTGLYLIKKIIELYNYTIIEEDETAEYFILKTDIPVEKLFFNSRV
jgi:hypothetical protein